jgi:hypothetical protein
VGWEELAGAGLVEMLGRAAAVRFLVTYPTRMDERLRRPRFSGAAAFVFSIPAVLMVIVSPPESIPRRREPWPTWKFPF